MNCGPDRCADSRTINYTQQVFVQVSAWLKDKWHGLFLFSWKNKLKKHGKSQETASHTERAFQKRWVTRREVRGGENHIRLGYLPFRCCQMRCADPLKADLVWQIACLWHASASSYRRDWVTPQFSQITSKLIFIYFCRWCLWRRGGDKGVCV